MTSEWTDEQYAAYELGMQTEREHQNALSKLVIEKHQAEIERLTAQLRQAQAGDYRPISLATFDEDGFTVAIADNLLSILWDEDGEIRSAHWTMPYNHAVCQWVRTEGVPGDVPVEAITKMVRWYEQGASEVEQHEVAIVRAWLARWEGDKGK